MTVIDPDWEPANPPYKISLPVPVHFFTVGKVRDDGHGLGWKYIGPCEPRASCCGSRAELRFPDGRTKIVRFGGITGGSVIVSSPTPVGNVPIGTEVWLLETEETDYSALVDNDPAPLPAFSPTTNPVDHDLRRWLRNEVDAQLNGIIQTPERDLLAEGRSTHPARLADGLWVVYILPCGDRILYAPDTQSYIAESLEGTRTTFRHLSDVLSHISG